MRRSSSAASRPNSRARKGAAGSAVPPPCRFEVRLPSRPRRTAMPVNCQRPVSFFLRQHAHVVRFAILGLQRQILLQQVAAPRDKTAQPFQQRGLVREIPLKSAVSLIASAHGKCRFSGVYRSGRGERPAPHEQHAAALRAALRLQDDFPAFPEPVCHRPHAAQSFGPGKINAKPFILLQQLLNGPFVFKAAP